MAISFIRVDDRLLHGQVVTRWVREKKCDGIFVVDDESAQDKVLSMVLKTAAPMGIKVGVFTVDEALPKLKRALEVSKSYFLIVKSPVTLLRIVESGINLPKSINVGPMSTRPGTVTIGANAAVTEEEKKAFDRLSECGYDIVFQLVPGEKFFTWDSVKF